MPNTAQPHSKQNVFTRQTNPAKNNRSHHDLRQDKIAQERDRAASRQPASDKIVLRSHQLNKTTPRTQKKFNRSKKTKPLTLHVNPIVIDELDRIAKREGTKENPLSRSVVGGKFLAKGLQGHIDMQYGTLLEPVIKEIIREEMRGFKTLLTWLLTRVAFDAAQSRILTKNILSRQPGLTPKRRDEILDECVRRAKKNITRETPQLKEIVEAVERWMYKEGKENA